MSSTSIPSPASTRSKSTSLRTLWSGTQSTLKRIFSSPRRTTASLFSRTASRSEGGSIVRYIITLPPTPSPPTSTTPRCFSLCLCLRCRRLDRDTVVAIACPPVAVYRGAAGGKVDGRVGVAVVLTFVGWVPGVICEDTTRNTTKTRESGELEKGKEFADDVDVDALSSTPEKPTSPYYWHTSERSSSAVMKRPRRRRSTLPSKRQVKRVV
ncbi:hypothetical protein BDP81DRAFT_502257 [Colletotrichum phormii]|uniref:Uncharacterized protein n=1 Tax=Colletotrichum phormii TaxID=359342 RepID=A0AAI9ZIH0_9PEZI|nr:uncharacterized protein BDP81DRAFT_502257 [Colletotrichum phormii]KAK1624006.1 hypothetical protein BDP81DRAFT_502257 [Colletotrichum phormii]